MSTWAYRDCNKCGISVHINFKCDCGGDPWGIIKELEKDLDLVNEKINFHQTELDNFKDRKKVIIDKLNK